jgi:hypothetical protein
MVEAPEQGCKRNLSFEEIYYVDKDSIVGYNDFRKSSRISDSEFLICGDSSRLCKQCAILWGYLW